MKKYILQTLCFSLLLILLSACSNKPSADKSPIKDIPDEVYEQMIENYFFIELQMKFITGEITEEESSEGLMEYILNHERYEEAEKNAKEYKRSPFEVFPNPLFADYIRYEEKYNETETMYIEKLMEFNKAQSRMDKDTYNELHTELKDELSIQEEFNPFTLNKED